MINDECGFFSADYLWNTTGKNFSDLALDLTIFGLVRDTTSPSYKNTC